GESVREPAPGPASEAAREPPVALRSRLLVSAGPLRIEALGQGHLAELVIQGPLVGVAEHLVGVRDLLEALLGRLVAGVLVRVMAACQRPIRLLDLVLRGRPLDAQRLVEVLHGSRGCARSLNTPSGGASPRRRTRRRERWRGGSWESSWYLSAAMASQLDPTLERADLRDALTAHPYADFLARMQKPGRYLGGEEQAIIKDHAGLACRFVLAFPDLYEIGMSHLGTRIIYDLVNHAEDLCCERAFSPWTDMEAELRARNLPLVSLETHTPLARFDVVGVSLQYELSYSNVLLNLDLGGIPLRSTARSDADPIVIAGGPTATHPEPLAPFIDLFLVGEAEEILPELL